MPQWNPSPAASATDVSPTLTGTGGDANAAVDPSPNIPLPQQYGAPSVRIAQTVFPSVEMTGRYMYPPLTATGVLAQSDELAHMSGGVAPRLDPAPQQYAAPAGVIPQVPLKLVDSAVKVSPPLTAAGTADKVSEPFPSRPQAFPPQQRAAPLCARPQDPVCKALRMAVIVWPPSTAAGVLTSGGFPERPFPIWP